jgi:hypothetical protein
LAEAHNSLRINNQDAYPANKPYYSDPFRLSVCGKNPQTYETDNTFTIETASFSRIKNVGTWKRKITFNKTEIIVTDYIDGRGQHRIERNLHTTLTVTLQDKVIDIGNYELRADDKANLTASNIWPTYGQKASATALSFTSSVNLPWTGRLILKIKS